MNGPRTDYINEVVHLLRGGTSHEGIPARLGLTADGLARNLHRNGRTDLARPFWAMSSRQRRADR